MATFTTNANKAARFDQFDIADLEGEYVYSATSTTWRTGPLSIDLGTNVELQGSGFTYSSGALTGGTITSIATHVSGPIGFQISGMSMSVATFNSYKSAGDGQGFLAAVFSGNDTLTGSNLMDVLNGFAGADTLVGLAGTDTLYGDAGNDSLDGGAATDILRGGSGDDTYYVDNAGDNVTETSSLDGTDTVISSAQSYALTSYVENLTLTGKAATGIGNGLSNTLTGNALDNLLDGKGGADTMIGGAGDDTYTVNDSGDKVTETSTGGFDTLFASVSFTLPDNVENLYFQTGAIDGKGNAINNTIQGNSADNSIEGGAGDDDLHGNSGDDTLIGGAGNDELEGGTGNDTLDTSLGNDRVIATSIGFDVVLGFDGNASGGQDFFDLDNYFDNNGVANGDRAERVGVQDKGDIVNIWLDTNGDDQLDKKIAEIHTVDVIKIGEDIVLF